MKTYTGIITGITTGLIKDAGFKKITPIQESSNIKKPEKYSEEELGSSTLRQELKALLK